MSELKKDGRKPRVRNRDFGIITVISAFGIIISAVIVWAIVYITSVGPPPIDTGEKNPFSRTFGEQTTPKTTGEQPPLTDTKVTEPNTDDPGPEKTEEPQRKEEFYNILLCGRDFLGATTDVMMVLSYDVKKQEFNILQILRDTYVVDTAHDNAGRRVNAVFTKEYAALSREGKKEKERVQGGMKAAEHVVEDTFGISINRYVYIDLSGFRSIVDTLGGVELAVPYDLHYEDPGQDLYIDLKKGYQTLDGDKALQFVRFRSDYAEGDLGRVDAQKIFMSAFIKKVLSTSTIKKLPGLLSELYKYMVTDLSTNDCSYFIKNAVNLKLETIFMYTTPGQYYQKENGAVYYSLYENENLEIINKAFNCMTADITAKNMNLREVVRTDEYDRISTKGKSIAELLNSPPVPPIIK